jgi:hypothetical protein
MTYLYAAYPELKATIQEIMTPMPDRALPKKFCGCCPRTLPKASTASTLSKQSPDKPSHLKVAFLCFRPSVDRAHARRGAYVPAMTT